MTAAKTPSRTRSEIGRSNRRRGNQTQTLVARALRPWWPEVSSNRNNGSAFDVDQGDLTGIDRLTWWSIKYDQTAHQDGQRCKWMDEMRAKAGPARFGILVERRPRVADPLRWFAHLWLDDYLRHVIGVVALPPGAKQTAVRLYVRDLVVQLAWRGLTDQVPTDAPGAVS